jgi:hypothetical protein
MRDLDEYTDLEIADEYRRRFHLINSRQCTYCMGKVGVCGCKMNKKRGMANGDLSVLVSGLVSAWIKTQQQKENRDQGITDQDSTVVEPSWISESHLSPESRRKAQAARDQPRAEDFRVDRQGERRDV